MSDIITPRTDAARFNLVCPFDQGGIYDADPKRANDGEWVPVDVCAQLETELAAMTALADRLAVALSNLKNEVANTLWTSRGGIEIIPGTAESLREECNEPIGNAFAEGQEALAKLQPFIKP
jgi:hypothetical protein